MTKLLLSLHVLAAIVAIGPVTVAASMFPAATRRAFTGDPDGRSLAVLANLHRICRVYAALGLLVPVFGLATASSLGVLTDAWLIASIVLTAVAAVVLAFLILPGQAAVLAGPARAAVGPAGTGLAEAGPAAAAGAEDSPAGAGATGAGAAGAGAAEAGAGAAEIGVAGAGPAGPGPAGAGAAAARLGMVTGVFNLLWAVVVVLMIVRPGSTTGA